MKRLIVATLVAMSCSSSFAAEKESPIHFGIGLNAGTNGIGIDASLGLTRFFQIRGGYTFMPKHEFEYNADIYNDAQAIINTWNAASPSLTIPSLPDETPIIIQPNLSTAHLLLDLYPAGSFHFTVGAYFGAESVISTWNTEKSLTKSVYIANQCIDKLIPVLSEYATIHHVGVQMGDYLFTPDADGNIQAEARVNKVRPYVGIGFGRAVPRKSRVGCSLDLGVQYWGKPAYYCNDTEVEPAGLDAKSYVKTATTIPVYPVITFRLCGRIF